MTATWLRVENDRPARLTAPTHAAPPTLEGIDKLFESPLDLRAIAVLVPHRACDDGELAGARHHSVHLFQFPNEEKMGTVRIACGGDALHADGAQALAAFALQSLRNSTTKGAAILLDSCTTRTPRDSGPDHQDDVAPLVCTRSTSNCNASRFLKKPSTGATPSAIDRRAGPIGIGDAPLLFWEQHKPNIHRFTSNTSAVPLHPLLCVADERPMIVPPGDSKCATIVGDTWIIAALANCSDGSDQKAKQTIAKYYATTYRRLLGVLRGILMTAARCVALAYPNIPSVSSVAAAVAAIARGGGEDVPIAAFGVFTLGGLTFASRTFMTNTNHWEKLMIAAVAMDMLIPKANTFDTSVDQDVESAIRVVELPMRMARFGGDSGGASQPTVIDLVLVSVGSAMTMVFLILPRPGVKGSALASLMRQKLVVPATMSQAYQKHCKRNMPPQQTTAEASISGASPQRRAEHRAAASDGPSNERVPLFPGLEGRGSGSMRVHVEAVTCEPTDVASGKLLDDMSTSDEEGTGFDMCGCVSSSKTPAYGEHSYTRKISMVEQDALDSLVLRYAARLKRIDERAFGAIPAAGIRMYHSLLTVGAPILVSGPRRMPLQRLQELKSSMFQSFEVSWWRHAAIGAGTTWGPCSTSAVGDLCANVVSATEHALQCVGTKIPWSAHISFSQIEASTDVQPSVGSGQSAVIVSHTQRALLNSAPCAVCTSTAAVHGQASSQTGEWADWGWTPELDGLGLNAPSEYRPVGMTRTQWKALRSLHRLSVAVLEGSLLLQQASVPPAAAQR